MAKSMEPPAVPTEAPDVELLQMELTETRERLAKMEALMVAVEGRLRMPLPGQPATATPLDGDAKVERLLKAMDDLNKATLAEAAQGPIAYEVVLMTGENENPPTKRLIGAHSEGDAKHKYCQCVGIGAGGVSAPSSIRVKRLTPEAQAA